MENRDAQGYPVIHNLDGSWRFQLDQADIGIDDRWFAQDLSATINVPGSWEEQGFGAVPETVNLATWTKKHQYTGSAWYQRSLKIDELPPNGKVILKLAGVRWRSRVWVDEQYVGEADSLSVAHRHTLTGYLEAGKTYQLTIQVNNEMLLPLEESHINSLQTATWWGGISGSVDLCILSPASIAEVTVLPDIKRSALNFEVEIDNHSLDETDPTLIIEVTDPETGRQVRAEPVIQQDNKDKTVAVSLELGEAARLWSDVDPFLYDVRLELRQNGTVVDQQGWRTGLRSIEVRGQQILLNGQPVFLSGYVDCCIFPNSGYPSWKKADYLRQFAIAKAHGFNHVRLHSWHPPTPFFEAADEAGMLVQTEIPNWTDHYGRYEQGAPAEVHSYLLAEMERIVRSTNRHPSWIMYSNGNELIYGADGHPQLNELLQRARSLDRSRLLTDNTGFGQLPAPQREVDFFIQSCNWHPPQQLYAAATSNSFEDFRAVTALTDKPVIAHEHGQFSMYVRPQEKEQYKGVIEPTWLESILQSLARKGMLDQIEAYIAASSYHLLQAYKENIERARRTPGLSGIQLLDIRDFPGQGHATTGILDMFWESKGIIKPEEFALFNGPQVLLMRSPSRTLQAGKPLEAVIELSNFGAALGATELTWRLKHQDKTLASGSLPIDSVDQGSLIHLTALSIETPAEQALHLVLEVELDALRNAWSFWTFPLIEQRDFRQLSSSISTLRAVMPGADFSDNHSGTLLNLNRGGSQLYPDWQVAISQRLTLRLLQYLSDGGRVWLMPDEKQLYDQVATRFLPPFWSYLHFPDNVSSVMGTLVSEHASLGAFPHGPYSDWHWFDLFNHAPAICLDSVPHLSPIVEVIDNFNRAKRLTYAFEAAVGKGKLYVSTWPLYRPSIVQRPEARFLFHEILNYLQGEGFQPSAELTLSELLGLFKLTNRP
ncbi:MAG: sugar-binding domain-containing protein [Chloroflexota bacterium]